MSTGTPYKRIKRRFKKKLYNFLVTLNDFNFGRLRPLYYLTLIAAILLAWAKLPTGSSFTSTQAVAEVTLAASLRNAMTDQTGQPVDVVALFIPPEKVSNETLYSFYLTGTELSYLAEGAVATLSRENSLYLDGVSFTYHKNRLPFNRVTSLSTSSGESVVNSRLYHVISTEDIFALFHYVSYRSIGIMNIYPKDVTGTVLSDYQKVILSETGTPFTMQTALSYAENTMPVTAMANTTTSAVTIQSGFNLIDLVKEPNRITICVCALFIAFFSLLWYIVPRINRIRIWFRIYRIRSRKRSTHSALYSLKKRF